MQGTDCKVQPRQVTQTRHPYYDNANCTIAKSEHVGHVVPQLARQSWDLKVESSSPGRCTLAVFLGKTLNSHIASLHPGV